MVIIPYFPVRDEALARIIHLKLGKIVRRLADTHKTELTYDDALVKGIADRCTEVESGARNVDNILTNTLLPDLSRSILEAMVEGEPPRRIHVTLNDDGTFRYSRNADAPGPQPAVAAAPA
jgi:type VI secretion system protein VasG